MCIRDRLYPTAKMKPEPFTVPQVNSGEEHVLFVQVLLCALLVAFVFFARSAGAPFLEDMRAEYHEMMTAVSYTHLERQKKNPDSLCTTDCPGR